MSDEASILVSASGKDRPGIVAAVTRVLYEVGANLEDSSMTRLEGEFAMLVIASVDPERLSHLRERFEALARVLELCIHVKPLAAPSVTSPADEPEEPYLISLYGADRPGLVYRVANLLALLGVNITDVVTHRSQAPGVDPLYQLVLEVELPVGVTGERLNHSLGDLGREMGVEITAHPVETVEL